MIGKKINSVQEVPVFEVKEILKERSKDGDLNYEQNLTYEYSKKFSKLTKANGDKMLSELRVIEGMTDSFAISIVNIVPADLDILNLLVPKGSSFNEESLKKILSIVNKHKK